MGCLGGGQCAGDTRRDELEARLRRVAFGAPEHPGRPVLRDPAALFDTTAPARCRWLAAVALGGQGWYAAAAGLLEPLRRTGDPVLAALAGAALASHRRQLGGHAVARALDSAALGRLAAGNRAGPSGAPDPDGLDPEGAWHDVLVGLAADEVGCGRPDLAPRLLDRADTRSPSGWRGRVRACWVRAEAALAGGDVVRAVTQAEQAGEWLPPVGASRHRIKSRLVLAAAMAAQGTESGRGRALALASECACASLDSGFLPLHWPSALLLAELGPDHARHWLSSASDALNCVYVRTDGSGRRLAVASSWIPTHLLRNGDGTAASGLTDVLMD